MLAAEANRLGDFLRRLGEHHGVGSRRRMHRFVPAMLFAYRPAGRKTIGKALREIFCQGRGEWWAGSVRLIHV
jgi:hypothetical protein